MSVDVLINTHLLELSFCITFITMAASYSVFLLLVLTSISTLVFSSQAQQDFTQCLILHSPNSTTPISSLVYTPNSTLYNSILVAYIQNLRVLYPTPHPYAIVAPIDELQIKATLFCAQNHNLQIRIRSGGHDFEGLSSISQEPYIILDLFNHREISVDAESDTAWVQSGATLGELYYRIYEKSKELAFPGGFWSSVGVGGLISGGGYGSLIRKFGLASDNVIDVRFLDVNGAIWTKKTMSEDLFWAVRGGGGGNFGIVLAWKLQLARVPEVVTYCHLERTSEQNATKLLHKWQYIAPNMPKDLHLEVRFQSVALETNSSVRTILAQFSPVYLGRLETGLLPLMEEKFPELGVKKENCTETNWIRVVIDLATFPPDSPPTILLNRTAPPKDWAKQKSDYVQTPIPETGVEGLFSLFHKLEPGAAEMVWTPYGGRMSEISESETPYPHRAGNLFFIYEAIYWNTSLGPAPSKYYIWLKEMRNYMAQYVSKSPRGAYMNYRDLDLGRNNIGGTTSYEEASKWGVKYFKDNFKKLAQVKALIDPNDYFRNEQSIPPLFSTLLSQE